MKLASTALQTFFAQIDEGLAPPEFFSADLYTIVTGSGRIVLNQKCTPSGGSFTITAPSAGTWYQDLGVRQANGDMLQVVTGSPGTGQYSVSGGTYHFSDSTVKLITYIYTVGVSFVLPAPNVLRSTTADIPITLWGQSFHPSKYGLLSRSKIKTMVGLEVATLDLKLSADPTIMVGSIPIMQYIRQGGFNGATVLVQRVFASLPDWTQPTAIATIKAQIQTLGPIIAFSGTVGQIKANRLVAEISVKSRAELFDIQMPRNLYQPGCRWTLFDQNCTLNPATYTNTGTAGGGSTAATITTGLTQLGEIPNPTASLALTQASHAGVNLLAGIVYFLVYTYVTPNGETTYGPYASITCNKNSVPGMPSPSSVSGATGYNVYASNQPGSYQLQNQSPIAFGTPFAMDPNGILQGAQPPMTNNSGYWDLGVITFTSGVNAGIARVVASYATGGNVTVVPALPNTPGVGDAFTIVPGCNKALGTCLYKYANTVNFGGNPFIPLPEDTV